MNNRGIKRYLGLALAASFLLCSPWARAHSDSMTNAADRPTTAVEPMNCVTSECHTEVVDYEMMHGPAAAKTCDACHWLLDAEKHTFEMRRSGEKLCTFCHEFDTGALPVVHHPVTAGECLGCHNPHGGHDRSFAREDSMSGMCGRCHESVTLGKTFAHDPVQKDECANCHRPHASKYPMLLDAVGDDLCLACHEDFMEEAAHAEFQHEALKDGCTQCHDVHASDNPMGLNQSTLDLCLGCHEDIKESTEAAHQHPAALGERACLTCHTPHGGGLAHLMYDLPVKVCLTCHDEEIPREAGGVVASMAELEDPTRIKHTPIEDGQCGGCHDIHGGANDELLSRSYSDMFYEGFSRDKYSLCFDCHEEHLADSMNAVGFTEFRNGELNLHYVHVAQDELGRNCRVCHDVHSAKQESLIRDSVKFGGWPMEIRFEKSITGGTCMTGCHPQYSYDRETPEPLKATPDNLERSPRVPLANRNEPIVVEWSGRDIRGESVAIPADDAPSVLLFLRADRKQSRQVVEMTAAAAPEIAEARVVVVFSGEQAEKDAQIFDAENPANWKVIADPKHDFSGSLGVEVWPAAIVADAAGRQLAHMGGASPALTQRLKAHLDLAAGRIDKDALRQRLAQTELVNDGPEWRASWHLRMGGKHLEAGEAAKARAMFADGLKYRSDSRELRIGLIRALLMEQQGEAALEELERIDDQAPSQASSPAAEPSELDLLRGRAMALCGRWEEAERLATEALAADPDLPEAHVLMGAVYEHRGDWKNAAQSYQKGLAGSLR